MAEPFYESVEIFDDFGEAETMTTAFCQQVSDGQYEEDTRSETDKALGELCQYLDQNPEVYARVLRKRKQEEMENDGIVSYFKSKVMSLVHRDRYPHCLVSASECVQQMTALKAGMCKTFQLAQDLKGNGTRYSERLANRRQAQMSGCLTDEHNLCHSGATDKSNSNKLNGSELAVSSVPQTETCAIENTSSNSDPCDAKLIKDGVQGSEENKRKSNGVDTSSKVSHKRDQPACLEVSSAVTVVPAPPPAPPLPINLFYSKNSTKNSGESQASKKMKLSPKPRTPEKVRRSAKQTRNTTPRRLPDRASVSKIPTRSSSIQNLSTLSTSDSSCSSSPAFLTPELPLRLKSHKRTQSNSSMSSLSSYGSFSSINSEIVSMNPVIRLKATPVIRSPGGTPLRTEAENLPSEPFHRALYSALRSRFKNVSTPSPHSGNISVSGSTPSPHSGNISVNGSNTSTLNNTFSP